MANKMGPGTGSGGDRLMGGFMNFGTAAEQQSIRAAMATAKKLGFSRVPAKVVSPKYPLMNKAQYAKSPAGKQNATRASAIQSNKVATTRTVVATSGTAAGYGALASKGTSKGYVPPKAKPPVDKSVVTGIMNRNRATQGRMAWAKDETDRASVSRSKMYAKQRAMKRNY